MAKNKLSLRIANAVRALRGEPWPATIEPPRITYKYLDTQTLCVAAHIPLAALDRMGQEVTEAKARQYIAKMIGPKLLEAGAIEITKSMDLHTSRANYYGHVRVVMPEADERHNTEKEG